MPQAPPAPFLLAPWFSPRPWGSRSLEPYFPEAPTTEPIGEAWITGPQSRVAVGPRFGRTLAQLLHDHPHDVLGPEAMPGDHYPLLVKFLFPNDRLSIQVHPDDPLAHQLGHPRGKTECWYVLHAEPRATIQLGLKDGATPQIVEQAIADNTLEQWLIDVPVRAGDMVFVDAGTVHAIGPGVVLLEVQQQSDLTYRMYDYGRPRELHLEQALRAMKMQTFAGKITPRSAPDGAVIRIDNDYFTVTEHYPRAGEQILMNARPVPTTCVLLEGDAGLLPDNTPGIDFVLGHAMVIPPTNSGSITTHAGARILEILPGPAATL